MAKKVCSYTLSSETVGLLDRIAAEERRSRSSVVDEVLSFCLGEIDKKRQKQAS